LCLGLLQQLSKLNNVLILLLISLTMSYSHMLILSSLIKISHLHNISLLFRSYLKDSLLTSSLPILTQTVCYQTSSWHIELTTQRRPLCWRSWRTFFLQSTQEIYVLLFCWTYRRPLIRSIMVLFCIDWTLPNRSWDQCNNGLNPICQTGYSTCELDLPPHHSAPWCVVYLRVPSLVPYISFVTAATCSWSLKAMGSARIYMLMTHRSIIYNSCRPSA